MSKNLEKLNEEIRQAETQLAQEKHKVQRLENRIKHLEKGERKKRTHRLCNLGGTIESVAPEVKELTRTEIIELMEHIFSLPEVQRAVHHMAITHISKINREKEMKADGTIPLYSRPRGLPSFKVSPLNRRFAVLRMGFCSLLQS